MSTITDETSNVLEVAENLYRIRLPMPFELNHINVYVIKETNRLALLDCGLDLPDSWEALTKGFAALGIQPGDLTDIFVTHAHPDHIGQFNRLRSLAPQARLFIHQREYDWIARRVKDMDNAERTMHAWLKRNGDEQLEAHRLARAGIELLPTLQEGDRLVEGQEHVRLDEQAQDDWQVVWTPGHTAGHFVLYNAGRKLLLSGDHLLTKISSNIGKYPGSTDDPLGEFMSSLGHIRELDLRQVLPAHGEPFANYQERIDYLLDHHRKRLEKIYAKLENGPRTPIQIVEAIWGRKAVGFNRYLALVEALSHLERLRREGRVAVEEDGPTIYYRAA